MVFAIDLGGVLVHDPLHELLDALEGAGGKPQREIQAWYLDNLRYPLWSGTLQEEEFWEEIIRFSGASGTPQQWREFLEDSLRLLPAAERIEELAAQGPLFTASNHRSEWIMPVLQSSGLADHFTEILISSEVGEVKPDPEFFHILTKRAGTPPSEILFIDNLERNTKAARAEGMETLLADPGGDWVDGVLTF